MEDHTVILEIPPMTMAVPVRGFNVNFNIPAKPLPFNFQLCIKKIRTPLEVPAAGFVNLQRFSRAGFQVLALKKLFVPHCLYKALIR
ncbi:hypothetical protein BRCON_0142 [Candidatus Sumerlaea chitinivorans]|uniref:Uncharacterized protein n=1 Tax=Sumerlaea chitinivorans TaxID=2250252 RepID=A0A2Z4Y1T5_SUMC1|nr:hypothetical protein BRCON_0142 [Candidatus Sumerlaea chitinivorans]